MADIERLLERIEYTESFLNAIDKQLDGKSWRDDTIYEKANQAILSSVLREQYADLKQLIGDKRGSA